MVNFYWNQPAHQSLQLVEPPESEPVTLEQAKKHCRVEITDDDDLIAALIVAARQYCESKTRRAIMPQTWQFNLDSFPLWRNWTWLGSPISIPLPPLREVNVVKYLDTAGELQEVNPDLYMVDTASEPGRIVRKQVQPWPIAGFFPGAVQIEFDCGYETVPQPIVQAMLLLIGHWYGQREAVSTGTMSPVPMAVDALLATVSFGGYW